jgi:hypothetical protein
MKAASKIFFNIRTDKSEEGSDCSRCQVWGLLYIHVRRDASGKLTSIVAFPSIRWRNYEEAASEEGGPLIIPI